MPFTDSLAGSAPMLAWTAGTFVVLGLALGAVLTVYAIYWMIFKMGKD